MYPSNRPKQETWLVYYGDICVGVIAERVCNPTGTAHWQQACVYTAHWQQACVYPSSHPRECTSGRTARGRSRAQPTAFLSWLNDASDRATK
jgi:hypothetical protein